MEKTEHLYTLNSAEKRLGTYSTLLRRLIEVNAIPTSRIGNAIVLDQAGYDRVREALEQWRCRPRMTRRATPLRLQHISE